MNQKDLKNIIYVYKDEGVGTESHKQTLKTLNKFVSNEYKIKTIEANQVMKNEWSKTSALFVMPGGADLPYVKKLCGKGCDNIQSYVKNGGSYLGICAGAYFASSYVEFDKGGALEVLGSRELQFFEGKAVGPVLSKYNYKNHSGSLAAHIILNPADIKETKIFYNGGCYFDRATSYPNTTVIGYYHNHLPAIVNIAYGDGQVILSGPHFEYDPHLLNNDDPYLKPIIPDMKSNDSSREILTRAILEKLGVQKKI